MVQPLWKIIWQNLVKVENAHTIQSNNPTPRYIANHTLHTQKQTAIRMFTLALIRTTKIGNRYPII